MKNCIEILQENSLSAMNFKLESVYLEDLGIQKVILSKGLSDVQYLLHDPKKLPFPHTYSVNFVLQDDDIQILVEKYIQHILSTASDADLQTLRQAIDRHQIRASIYRNDDEAEAEIVPPMLAQYLDVMDQLLSEQVELRVDASTWDEVQIMDDILATDDVSAMLDKIETFYQQELGILSRMDVSQLDEDSDDIQTVLYVADDYAKIKGHGIQIKAKAGLDPDDLNTILSTYFKPGIACLSLDALFAYGMQTKKLYDASTLMRDQQDYQISRYMGPLHFVIKERLQVEMDILLKKETISVHELTLIMKHLDLLTEPEPDDIQNYLTLLMLKTKRRDPGNLKQSELRILIKEEKIKNYFMNINMMKVTGSADLLEACDLQSYLTLLQWQKSTPNLYVQPTLNELHPIIETGLRKLLMDYKQDVVSTISDMRKTQKLKSIDEMLKNMDDQSLSPAQRILNIKTIFDTAPTLHKTESLGRFLYRCICAWLNKPNQLANYHMTLFKSFTTEEAEDKVPKFQHPYKKLN